MGAGWKVYTYVSFSFENISKLYRFGDFTNPLVLSNFSKTNYFTGHFLGTNLK